MFDGYTRPESRALLPFTPAAEKNLFLGLSLTTLCMLVGGIVLQQYLLFLIPPFLILLALTVADFSKIYYLMLLMIPFTTEFSIPGAFTIELPAEPLAVLLTGVLLMYLLTNRFERDFFRDPVIQVLLIHMIWIGITVIFSEKKLISLKWLLSKGWFVGTFVFVTALIVRSQRDFRTLFWALLPPTVVAIIVIIARHALTAFDFEEINWACSVFFRNHVNYAAFISTLMPFIWLAATWYKKQTLPAYFIAFSKALFLVATYFAYARGAWLGLITAVAFYVLLKYRLVKYAVAGVVILFSAFAVHLSTEKQYITYAPDYEKAIYHGNILDHLKATLKNQDISTAERFYRWVAGVRMSTEHPVTGFGPGSFYYYYQRYAVTAFETYVSDNPEKSGVHNYLLMTLIEQGFPGLIIFILFTFLIFYEGIRLYHRTPDKGSRYYVAAILCSLVVFYVQLMLSDLVEAFQLGALFFINIALLVNYALEHGRRGSTVERE
ncbi:MAG: hypothetical protein KatS3mg031_2497 [Chitinophagales bacterium]|nr:MAG: hypothetical protein KatS3mg031_2497 [Chitinophagales bacterium]